MIQNLHAFFALLIVGALLIPAAAGDLIFTFSEPVIPPDDTFSQSLILAEKLAAQGNLAEALEQYLSISSPEGTDEYLQRYYLGKAHAYVRLGDRVAAIMVLDQAIQNDPLNPSYWAEKAMIMYDAGYSHAALYPVVRKAHDLNQSDSSLKSMLDTVSDSRQAALHPEPVLPKCELCGYDG